MGLLAIALGSSDFGGAGPPDYVLQNGNTNQTAIWYLNNNVFVSGAGGPTLLAGWTLVEVFVGGGCAGCWDYP